MGTPLTGKTPKNTFKWLAHFGSDGPLHASTPRTLTMGDGSDTPISFTLTKAFVGGFEVETVEGATGKADAAQAAAISTASSDATNKADAAQAAAISTASSDATSKADAAQAAAISAAATDATTKANTAQSNAISAAATDATTKANAAQSAAISSAASAITGAAVKTLLVDADEVTLVDSVVGATQKSALTNLWTWIVGKIGTITSITAGGSWSFSGTARPTSGGSGSPDSNSLITLADSLNERLCGCTKVRTMTTPNATSSTGTISTAISSGIVSNCNTFTVSSAGGARLIEFPSTLSNPTFATPISVAVHGRILPFTTASSSVARLCLKSSTVPNLANNANAISVAGFGVEFYAVSGGYRARLFYRADGVVDTTYSGTGSGGGTVAISAPTNSLMGIMIEHTGNGTIKLYIRDNQTAFAEQLRIPATPVLSWAGITALSNTYQPTLMLECATSSSGTHGVSACVLNAVMTY